MDIGSYALAEEGFLLPNTTTTASTDVCQACLAKLTHVLTLEPLDNHDEPNMAPFSCAQCGHLGTVAVQAGHRIVKVETKAYLSPLGR